MWRIMAEFHISVIFCDPLFMELAYVSSTIWEGTSPDGEHQQEWVDTSQEERWFCTEADVQTAGSI